VPKGRPRFGYFIFDCPSDHEIDGRLLSEADAIRSVLANRNLGTQLKHITCTTPASFRAAGPQKYAGIRFVHLGGHASKTSLAFIGGAVVWVDVAKKLIALFPRLPDGEQRVLTLSCCYSSKAVAAMTPILKNHFTAVYHFASDDAEFSTAIATWGMFYLKKKLSQPHSSIKDEINTFLGQQVLRFVKI
jgi:hypothetical protein